MAPLTNPPVNLRSCHVVLERLRRRAIVRIQRGEQSIRSRLNPSVIICKKFPGNTFETLRRTRRTLPTQEADDNVLSSPRVPQNLYPTVIVRRTDDQLSPPTPRQRQRRHSSPSQQLDSAAKSLSPSVSRNLYPHVVIRPSFVPLSPLSPPQTPRTRLSSSRQHNIINLPSPSATRDLYPQVFVRPSSNQLSPASPRERPQRSTTTQNVDNDDTPLVQPDREIMPPPRQPPQPRRRRHADVPHRITYRQGLNVTPQALNLVQYYTMGNLNRQCDFCGAKFFQEEHPNRQGYHYICCKFNSVIPPQPGLCPPELYQLLTDLEDPLANQFRRNIRAANSSFAMASFRANVPEERNVGQGHWCFNICGQLYHYTESVPHRNLERPIFNQVYFLDAQEAIDQRTNNIGTRIDANTIRTLENMLRRVNPYIRAYATMGEVISEMELRDEQVENVVMMFKEDINTDLRRYGLPESRSDVAAVFPGEVPELRAELIVYPRDDPRGDNKLRNLNRLTDPMVYPLLFPHGDHGYDNAIIRQGRRLRGEEKPITFRQFYCHKIQIRVRPGFFSILHNSGKLFQQYLVDAWCKIEANQMWYLRQHQREFRVGNYADLQHYLEERARTENARVGKIVVLPGAHIGSPRYYNQRYLDAMTIVARYGRPHLLITLTCNPRWPEIKESLEFAQKWEHRPDIVSRVFHGKLKQFLDDLANKQVWGVVCYYHYVIEWQKRGLPHAHILVTFRPEDAPDTPDSVDAMISAVLPDEIDEPELFALVVEHQIHRPCGIDVPEAPCMKDGRCIKFYPKKFVAETKLSARGPAEYRRPDDGRVVNAYGGIIDNRRVVPYNRFALVKYRTHINFEACSSIGAVKYLYKYIFKGPDCITVQMNDNLPIINWNEIDRYLDCRYVSSMEAAWKILEFEQSGRSHSVLTLTVHDRNRQRIYFEEGDEAAAVENAANKETMLTAWFALNRANIEARNFRYVDIPEHYTWNTKDTAWKMRKQKSKMVGTLPDISPRDVELFHLRMLLLNVTGKTSFDDLLTVDDGGPMCQSFYEVCERLHLIERIDEYDRCIREASLYKEPRRLRYLFAMVCCVLDAVLHAQIPQIWRNHVHALREDFVRRGATHENATIRAYIEVRAHVRRNAGPNLDEMELVRAEEVDTFETEQTSLEDEDEDEPRQPIDVNNLNPDQRRVYDEVWECIMEVDAGRHPRNTLHYVDGPGGTGKTHLYNTLLRNLNFAGKSTIAVAWTGIAATLLFHGKTAHRAFHLPLNIENHTVAGWPAEDPASDFVKRVSLIVWDEAPMTTKYALEAVDRYLRDLMNQPDLPMGGKIVLLGGDFRQVLPVVPRAHPLQIMAVSLKASILWKKMKRHALKINMRAAPDEQEFSTWLLQIGDGRLPTRQMGYSKDDLVQLPYEIVVEDVERLLIEIFGQDFENNPGKRAILCPTNASVDVINRDILERVSGEARIYYSVDTYEEDPNEEFRVSMELLNSITSASLPPHKLVLKTGAVVMLLRNLDIESGLCNGTRLKIVEMKDYVLRVEALSGSNVGKVYYLPKIRVSARDVLLPKPITRLQFPVRLAYAITINKAQGQSLEKVGVCLKEPCFAHGQLYVAFSRVSRKQDVKIYVQNTIHQGHFTLPRNRVYTRNVVYRAILGESSIAAEDINPEEEVDDIFSLDQYHIN